MKRLGTTLLLLALTCSLGCARAVAQMNPVGRFADMRETGEHCSGYSLELWKLDGRLYGLFHACAGLAGDTPTGVLENVAFDETRHTLKFEAKLTMGSDFHQGAQTPSKDMFTFEGTLDAAEVSGNLKHEDRVYERKPPAVVAVHWRRQKGELSSYPSADAWRKANAALLQNAGPKW
ncbi:MAG TPA: hypothetical protein VGN16_12245 [Acidobacteriaceae bacterium]|jgi:hypothetical protein